MIRNHIFRQSSGKVFNFFFSAEGFICYSYLAGRNFWSRVEKIAGPGVGSGFDAAMDRDDSFHIAWQDSHGNINYTYINCDPENNLKTEAPVTALKSKNPSQYDKHIRILAEDKDPVLLYILRHGNDRFLGYQQVVGGIPAMPSIIDYIPSDSCYAPLYAPAGTLKIFYNLFDGNYMQVGYKKHTGSQKRWSSFIPVTNHSGNCRFISAIPDRSSNIHIIYERQTDNRYELAYDKEIKSGGGWMGHKILSVSDSPFEDASIAVINQKTLVYWLRDRNIMYASCDASGQTWTKTDKYPFAPGNPLLTRYTANNPVESDKAPVCTMLPANLENGLKLAFVGEIFPDPEAITAEDFKELITSTFKALKHKIESLMRNEAAMKSEIEYIKSHLRNLSQETSNISQKLQILLNEK